MPSLIAMLISPRRCCEQLKANPGWMLPFIVLASLAVAITIALNPSLIAMTLAHLPESATAETRDAISVALRDELAARCIFLPIRLLVGWALFALVLHFSCQAWGRVRPVRFVQIFSLEVHAEGALLLGHAGALALIFAGHSADALFIPFGLDTFVPASASFAVRSFLNAFNPFSAWYVALLGVGISSCCEFKLSKAVFVVLFVWGLNVSFNVVGSYILQESFHFRL